MNEKDRWSFTGAAEAQTERPFEAKVALETLMESATRAVRVLEGSLPKVAATMPAGAFNDLIEVHAALQANVDAIRSAMGPRVHRLKTDPYPFRMVWSGLKPYEVRTFDRDYRVGDVLHLVEFDRVAAMYSGAWIKARVTCITRPGEYGLKAPVSERPPSIGPGRSAEAGIGVLGVEVLDRGEAP